MDKRNLLNRLAAALGRGRVAKADDVAAAPAGPPADGGPEAGGDEPRRIGTMMPSMAPGRDDDLTKALAEVVAVAERAGRMLEAQAKRQQTAGDAVAELSGQVAHLADQAAEQRKALEALRAQLQRTEDGLPSLRESLEATVERLDALTGNGGNVRGDLAALHEALDDLHTTLARQLRAHAEALADIQTRVHDRLDRLNRRILLAALLAGAAFVAAMVVLLT